MDYRQIKAIEAKNKKRILEVCPECRDESGLYFLLRREDGFKWAYVGQSIKVLTRLAQHLSGYQAIDNSIRKHGLFSDENTGGYKVCWLPFKRYELDDKEQYYIRVLANDGWQMKNRTAGSQGVGKKSLDNQRSPKTYREGVAQGFLNARREVAHWFDKHLAVSIKKPSKNADKALQKFLEFIDVGGNDEGKSH